MKRFVRISIALIAVVIVLFAVHHYREKCERLRREAAYQATLHSYQEDLKIGMNRKEVEHLKGRGKSFRQMCCVDFAEKKHSWDDLVKIGEEETPWFCGENNVYIAFQFADSPKNTGAFWRADDFDTLKAISVFHQLEICL